MASERERTGEARRTVRVSISGRVQGVWFRAWTAQTARALGLSGWVRNRRDGTVEALFSGPKAAVATMLEHCREGPPAAEVAEVAILTEDDAAPEMAGFEIRPTA